MRPPGAGQPLVVPVVLVVLVVMQNTSPVGHDDRVRRRLPLAAQLLAMQIAIVLAVLGAAGLLAFQLQQEQIRETYAGRVLEMARSLAQQPAVREAYASDDPSAALQPLAELVRTSAGAEFVVFTDIRGVRYSHPDPDKIGRRVSTDPSVALGGGEFVGTETGTLGVSLRAKVPVRDPAGAVRGVVSVGILESELSADLAGVLPRLVAWLTGAAFVGVVGAVALTRLVRRRIHGLEPEEIAELLQAREAMLHGIREGVLAVDEQGASRSSTTRPCGCSGWTRTPPDDTRRRCSTRTICYRSFGRPRTSPTGSSWSASACSS